MMDRYQLVKKREVSRTGMKEREGETSATKTKSRGLIGVSRSVCANREHGLFF